jgi:hypothetical protein
MMCLGAVMHLKTSLGNITALAFWSQGAAEEKADPCNQGQVCRLAQQGGSTPPPPL